MKIRFLTYEVALKKHSNSYFEIREKKIDKSFPYYENFPVASYPAIFVWPEKQLAINDEQGEKCVAMYWLKESDF